MSKRRTRISKPVGRALRTIACLIVFQSSADAACDEDWLFLDVARDGNVSELHARNTNDYPITYSIRVRSNGERKERPRTFSGSLPGKSSERLTELPSAIEHVDELSASCRWTVGPDNATHDDDHVYLLPYADGSSFRVLQGFGSRFSHSGGEQYAVDFNMSSGTPVHAARSGVVARIEESNDKGCWEDGCGAFANFIVVLHDDGTTGEYYHLQQNGALVAAGDKVIAGQKIGLSGNTGHTTMPHLHFAVYMATKRGRSQSVPISFLSGDGVVYEPRRGRRYLAVKHQSAGAGD